MTSIHSSNTALVVSGETPPALPSIPGKMPKNANGILAIKAAWELENRLERRASAKAVMNLLIQWAQSGVKPDVLIGPGKDGRSVLWVTDKGKEKPYTTEALGITLQKWHESRDQDAD